MAAASHRSDSWPQLEQAALAAFAPYVNPDAPRLAEVIGRSARYAKIDRARREIEIDRRAFLLALVAVGLAEASSGSRGIAAWFASWLGSKVTIDATRLAELERPAEELLAAFNDKLRIVASQSIMALLPRAVADAERTCGRSKADLRHILAAMIATSYAGRPEYSDLGWTPSAADLDELRQLLLERIKERAEAGENLQAWQEVLHAGPAAGPGVAPPGPRGVGMAPEPSGVWWLGDDLQHDREKSEQWLRRQPPVVSVAIAVRMVLRILPLLAAAFGGSLRRAPDSVIADDVVMPVYLAAVFPWAAVRFPNREREITASDTAVDITRQVGETRSDAAFDLRVAAVVAAAHAAATAATAEPTDVVAHAANAIATGISAVHPAFTSGISAVLHADASSIEAGSTAADLAAKPLWPDRAPEDVRGQWERLKEILHSLQEDWEVWTEWYEARLQGRTALESLEIARATIPLEIWRRGSKAVNAHIRELEERFRETRPPAETPRGEQGAAVDQPPDSGIATRTSDSVAAGEILFIGDAPKRDEDFLGRAELAFILAARLNRIWDEMTPRTDTRPPLATRFRRAWNSVVRRSWRLWYRFIRRKVRRAWKRILRRENATPAYDAGFVVHLDAPWGGGKTTFANYLARILNPYAISGKLPDWLEALPLADDKYWPEAYRRPWQIVTFNAWQHQHVDPPWWCFYQAIRNQSSDALLHESNEQTGNARVPEPHPRFRYRGRVRRSWNWLAGWMREFTWRLLTPQFVWSGLVTLVTVSVAVLLVKLEWLNLNLEKGSIGANLKEASGTLAVILAILAGGGSFVWTIVSTFTGTLLTGTPDAAKNYSLGSGDPLERFRRHFTRMVERLGRPVLVIVDDIDRCEPRFVVELIRGMQTILKSPRVIFLLLGDGDWIEQSFAETHKAMKGIPVGPEHSFGGRFVEKAIQLSLMLPDISTDQRPTYVRTLLLGVESQATDPVTKLAEKQRNQVERTLRTLEKESNPLKRDSSAASLREEVSSFAIGTELKDAVVKSIDRTVALRSAADEKVSAATQHRLEPIARVLPPNPRQIKRIINAISLFQEIARIRKGVQPDTPRWQQLALWIVLMTEWPQTWATLATWPELIGRVLNPNDATAIAGLDEPTIQDLVAQIRANAEVMSLLEFPGPCSSDESPVAPSWRDAKIDAAAVEDLKAIIPPVSGKALTRTNKGSRI